MKINEVKIKSVLTRSRLPEADLVINPYIGCQHACIYCYADFMRRFTGHQNENWGEFVDVKINAAETIDDFKFPKDALILLGSVTDPYQPLELKYRITEKCLEKLLETQPNIEILTKSPLVLRDIDLLKQFKSIKVGISIGILDKRLAQELEPRVASPEQRLEALRKLHESGIKTYLFVSPIFPEISAIPNLLNLAGPYADEVMFESLNMNASNRREILSFIRQNRPELQELYQRLSKDRCYWDRLEKGIIQECESKRVKYRAFFHHNTKWTKKL